MWERFVCVSSLSILLENFEANLNLSHFEVFHIKLFHEPFFHFLNQAKSPLYPGLFFDKITEKEFDVKKY